MEPLLYTYFTIMVILGGACVGSFLNVCIYRIPLDLSIVHPRSNCPHCHRMIVWYDNIPILSYLVLRGKCRHCGTHIAARYWLVEGLTAILFYAVWYRYGWSPLTPIYWLVVSGLVVATFVDFDHMIIPDRISLGGIVAGLLLSPLFPELHGEASWATGLRAAGIGAAAGAGSLWLVAVIGKMIFRKDAMGLGDVKLLGAIGAFMGWEAVLFTVMCSSLAGSLAGLSFIVAGRHALQSRIPYGPYLALAAVIWLLWGYRWWDWYVGWLAGSGASFTAF